MNYFSYFAKNRDRGYSLEPPRRGGSNEYPQSVSYFAKNIDRGYSQESPRRGGSNEYPQSMFFSKIRKNIKKFLSENFPFFDSKIFIIFE